jgi:hypothetical protein
MPLRPRVAVIGTTPPGTGSPGRVSRKVNWLDPGTNPGLVGEKKKLTVQVIEPFGQFAIPTAKGDWGAPTDQLKASKPESRVAVAVT